jgi:hypothetical protein
MYLPQSKYKKAKTTNGSEFIIKGTSEYYTGMYFETYKNQFFAGVDPASNGAELQKVSNHGDTKDMLLAMGMGLLGTAVAGFFRKKPTQSEKDKGVAKRYFVQDRNDNKIAETDKATYLQIKKDVPNRNFAQVDWIIKGPAEDKMFGNYPFEGAESKNRKTIQALESQMKGISTFITDYKYLVEDPAATQKPTLTTQTFIEKNADTQLENDRKANFDLRK